MPRQTELKHIDVAVLVLLNHQNRVLLTQRRDDVHLARYWEFPGGKIDANETPQQALYREIQEELAYQPRQATFWQLIEYDYPELSVRLHIFKEHANKPQVHNNEQQAMQWCTITDLTGQQLPPANQAIVDALLQHQDNGSNS